MNRRSLFAVAFALLGASPLAAKRTQCLRELWRDPRIANASTSELYTLVLRGHT